MMNKTVVVAAMVLALFVFSCSKGDEGQQAPAPSNQSMQAASADGGFSLEASKVSFTWKVQGDKLNVTLKAPTTGWVGVGFNPSDAMKDANFVIGYVKDGKAVVTDHHGTSKRLHKEDETLGGSDNLTDMAGTEADGSTEVSFTMPLKSDDNLDKEIQITTDQVVLLSYGKTDRMAQQHLDHATLKVNLSTGSYQVLN